MQCLHIWNVLITKNLAHRWRCLNDFRGILDSDVPGSGSGPNQNTRIQAWPKYPNSDATKTPESGPDKNIRIQTQTNYPDPDPNKLPGSEQTTRIRSDQHIRIQIRPNYPDPDPHQEEIGPGNQCGLHHLISSWCWSCCTRHQLRCRAYHIRNNCRGLTPGVRIRIRVY